MRNAYKELARQFALSAPAAENTYHGTYARVRAEAVSLGNAPKGAMKADLYACTNWPAPGDTFFDDLQKLPVVKELDTKLWIEALSPLAHWETHKRLCRVPQAYGIKFPDDMLPSAWRVYMATAFERWFGPGLCQSEFSYRQAKRAQREFLTAICGWKGAHIDFSLTAAEPQVTVLYYGNDGALLGARMAKGGYTDVLDVDAWGLYTDHLGVIDQSLGDRFARVMVAQNSDHVRSKVLDPSTWVAAENELKLFRHGVRNPEDSRWSF